MAKKLFLTVVVTLPSDPFAGADVYKALQPAWGVMLDALKTSGAPYDVKFQELDQRIAGEKPRKPPKPKLVTTTPSGEAA